MPSPSDIQAITFDVGGTLIEPWPSVGAIYAQAAMKHAATTVSAEVLKGRFVAAWAARPHFNHTRAEWAALVDETFRGLTAQPPSQTFFPELYEHFGRASAWKVFDDVFPTLDRFATHGLKLGVISNWDERLRPLLAELKLTDYFQVVVVSNEVGFPKPSPVIFEIAAEKLGLALDAILHVGDNAARDLDGARSAGFHGLLLKRRGAIERADQIRSLSEINLPIEA